MFKILITSIILFSQQINAEELIGKPKIVDGDTVFIGTHKIRLEGIDAPELKQKCEKKGAEYLCGKLAKNKLTKKINNQIIKCISSGKDRYKRHLATCYMREINLNKWMVMSGYAISYRRYSKKYALEEEFAEHNKLGLWSGFFIFPEKWRKLN